MPPQKYQIGSATIYRPKTNHTLAKMASLIVLVFFVILAGVIFYVYSKISLPLTTASHSQEFTVAKGEDASVVAENLAQRRLIGSAFIFRWYAALTGRSGRIQAGTYELDSNQPPAKILGILTASGIGAVEKRVTFLEGWTVNDYASALEKQGLFTAKVFLDKAKNFSDDEYGFLSDKPASAGLEGFLFPDTYLIREAAAPDEVLHKLLDNFGNKLTTELRSEIKRQSKTVFEIVTMASLVEGEVGRNTGEGAVLTEADLEKLSQERRLVAGVFYNRLAVNHALQSDATLNYIFGQKKTDITLEDTQVNNPYNTYLYRGLPPGPINNPSLDSILAAIYPAETDYFYFLNKPSGEAVFSKTLDEHNANKAEYLK